MGNEKVLVALGDATELLDTMYPHYRLQEASFDPIVIASERRLYQLVLHEIKPDWTIAKEWKGDTLRADLAFSEVDESEYSGIFFSGGRAPEYIRYDEDLIRIARHFFAKSKPIASVCHAVEFPHARVALKAEEWRLFQNVALIWKSAVWLSCRVSVMRQGASSNH